MRVHSHRSPSGLAGILFVLFIALSFNAYACLLPVNGVTLAAIENRCSTPDVRPVYEFCDAFKTFDVQSADTRHLNRASQQLGSSAADWRGHRIPTLCCASRRRNSHGISMELSAYHRSTCLSRRHGVDDVVYGALERARYVWHEHDAAHTTCRRQRRAAHRAARAIADNAKAGAGVGSICTTR